MLKWLVLAGCFVTTTGALLGQSSSTASFERDPQSVEILQRTIQANGGLQLATSIRDITENGEISFYWAHQASGPVTIQMLGGNHFRLEGDLTGKKIVWIAASGTGVQMKGERKVPLGPKEAVNLEGLTFPLVHIASALLDTTTSVSFVGIERRSNRSTYKIRIKGQLGLATAKESAPVEKDLLIDALTFTIVGFEDHPYPIQRLPRFQEKAPNSETRTERDNDTTRLREVDFSDFRAVSGVQVPFSITTKIHGQKIMNIQLSDVVFNTGIDPEQFQH